jgi:hypothetical protein
MGHAILIRRQVANTHIPARPTLFMTLCIKFSRSEVREIGSAAPNTNRPSFIGDGDSNYIPQRLVEGGTRVDHLRKAGGVGRRPAKVDAAGEANAMQGFAPEEFLKVFVVDVLRLLRTYHQK